MCAYTACLALTLCLPTPSYVPLQHAIAKISSAASKILPTPSSMTDGRAKPAQQQQQHSRKRHVEDEAASGQQQHKRARGLDWPPGELSDEEDPASQDVLGAGLLQLGELAGQHDCVVATKHTPKCLLEDSQTNAEE